MEEVTTIYEVAWTILRIYYALEDLQLDHQSSMVQYESTIDKQCISILIDLESSHNYVTPKFV